MKLSIEQTLQKGIRAHKEGNLSEAESFYRSIIKEYPQHPDANHNLGLILVSINKPQEAMSFFKIALDKNPKIEQFWFSYIEVLIREEHNKTASKIIKQAKDKGMNNDRLNIFESKLKPLTQLENSKSIHQKKQLEEKIPTKKQLKDLLEFYQSGNLPNTEKLAKSIIKEYPKHQFAYQVLGAVLRKLGRNNEALKANYSAVKLSPKDAKSHINLGIILHELGRFNEAEKYYRNGIALKPNFAEAHYNLGITLQELGRFEEAIESYKQAIVLKPEYANAYSNLGNSLQKLGKLEKAKEYYKYALDLKPDFAEAHYNYGNIQKELDKLDEALNSYKKAINLYPDFVQAYCNLGNTLQALGKIDEAEVNYKKAISIKPNYAKAHGNLANIFKERGRLDEAEAMYRKAIALQPDYAEAHRHLTLMKKFNAKDEQYYTMRELYLNKSTSDEQLCHINFGLAKAYEDLENFQQAYIHYNEGNDLRKKLLKYSIKKDEEIFKLIKINNPLIMQKSLKTDNTEKGLKPIFIVGMPRSGTTLIEQIISSHSLVTGAGELPFVNKFGWNLVNGSLEIKNTSLSNFREKYLDNLKKISRGNLIVTDKMPQNFRFIGLIFAAFPKAKIIHVKRNTSAVCWANYKQYFASKDIGYCYSLEDIVSYYKLYKNIMNFWRNLFGKRIYDLDYELLVENQEEETHKLINYLDLDWDKKFLKPEENDRTVSTASNLQVRQKVYKGSSNQWKKYKSFIGDVFDLSD